MQKLLSVRIGRLESLSRRGSCVGDCPPSSHRPLSNHLRKSFVSASATELFDRRFRRSIRSIYGKVAGFVCNFFKGNHKAFATPFSFGSL
ncbi:hypothetical protein RB195_004563 [Necator americanus]|uniref:Uncharacterized protein n=1 Tax=Necator americanus TaxID=51031 RepID=A0ABR1BMI6_NECAM